MKKQPLKIKICGMKHPENIQEVAALCPDYLGFIFYPKSPRNFEGIIPEIPTSIIKTGVFVDAKLSFIVEKVQQYGFKAVQLHGNESATYCKELRKVLIENESNFSSSAEAKTVEVFKVFGIKDTFDFSILKAYEPYVNFFLFDTKGKAKGGNGYTFDWSVLNHYKSKIPIILSGGIGVEEINKVKQLLKTNLPIYALDLNSKFESAPAFKNVTLLQEFLTEIRTTSNENC